MKASLPQNHRIKNAIKLGGKEIGIWRALASVLLVLLTAGSIFWFFDNHERVSTTEYQLTEHAIHNPYYAAELLINTHKKTDASDENGSGEDGIDENGSGEDGSDAIDSDDMRYATTLLDSDIKSLLDDLPHIDESMLHSGKRPVLIINSMAAKLSQERFDALQTWVENGGHLVTFTGMGVNIEELDELTAYIETLKADNAKPEIYQSDDTLNELTDNLGAGNQFLARLGVIAVDKLADCEEDCVDESGELQDEAMVKALENLEAEYGIVVDPITGEFQDKNDSREENKSIVKKDNSNQDNELTTFKNYLKSLRSNRKLAVVTVPDSATNSMGVPLLLKKPIREKTIYTDLFRLKYPEIVNTPQASIYPSYQTPDYRADSIRQYLKRELAHFEQAISVNKKNTVPLTVQGKSQRVIKPLNYKDEEFKHFIKLILSLEDSDLLSLFTSASETYIDVPFGKGRISVLTDRDNFTNPNPNIDIFDASKDTGFWTPESYRVALSEWTPLIELAGYNYRFNLASVDNANVLLELTKNSNHIWILPDTDIEALSVMLWKHAKFAVLGLMLLLVFWLWSLYDRFGKDKTLSKQKSHDILRYFQQVGRYGWDTDNAMTLLKLSRQQAKVMLYEQLPRLAIGQSFSTDIPFHTLVAVHSQYPTANPLAELSDKDLSVLSGLLIQEYQKKYDEGYADATKPLLMSPKNQVSYMDTQDVNRQIDVKQALSPELLHQAIIQPLQESHTAQSFMEITQTLWLLRWVLK